MLGKDGRLRRQTKVRIAHVSGRAEAGDEVTLALVLSDVTRDLEPHRRCPRAPPRHRRVDVEKPLVVVGLQDREERSGVAYSLGRASRTRSASTCTSWFHGWHVMPGSSVRSFAMNDAIASSAFLPL